MLRFVFMAVALALGLSIGCGQFRPKKVYVSGTVQMDDKPLKDGEIYFVVPGGGKPPEVLPVADGKFAGQVTLGTKRVEIHSPQRVDLKPGTTPMGPPPVINLVREDYNVNSTLTAEVAENGLSPSTFEVKSSHGKP